MGLAWNCSEFGGNGWEFIGSCLALLGGAGSCWELECAGNCQAFLGVSWELVGVARNLWELLGVAENCWEFLGVAGRCIKGVAGNC